MFLAFSSCSFIFQVVTITNQGTLYLRSYHQHPEIMSSTKETKSTPIHPFISPPSYFSTGAFALHSIPISYALSYPPHIYLFGKLMTASNYTYSNMIPRVQLQTLTP